jgi:hypothetical protein
MIEVKLPQQSFRTGIALTLAVVGSAFPVLGGCGSNPDRAAYFESRTALIQPQAGSGNARMALWPSTTWGRSSLAVADSSASDTLTPLLPAEANATR